MSTIPAVTCNTDWTLVYDSFLAGDFVGSLQTSGLSYFCVSATPPLTSQSGVNAGGDVEQIKLLQANNDKLYCRSNSGDVLVTLISSFNQSNWNGGGGGGGEATAALQEAGNASLVSIDSKLTNPLPVSGAFYQATQPVSVTSLPLPALAATSTQQGDGTQKTQIVDGAGTVPDVLNSGVGLKALNVAQTATQFIASTNNSTVAQLAAGATFTGVIETCYSQQAISLLLTSDQNGTLTLRQYIDLAGARVITTLVIPIVANVPFSRSLTANGNFFNLTFINNGGVATTTLNINTAYGTLPATTNLGNGNVSLDEMAGTALSAGQKAAALSIPVTLSNENVQDLYFAGQAAQTALINNIIPATASASATDCLGYRSGSVQIVCPAGTYTTGQIIFEGSNDNTNFQTFPVWSQLILTGTPIVAGITLVSNTNLIYTFPINFRYIRVRISIAVSGASASVRAFTRLTQTNWTPAIFQVAQATAANLNATVAGSLTTVSTVTSVTSVTSANLAINGIIADVTSGAIATTATTATITPTFGMGYSVVIPVTAVSGTNPTIDINVEESDDTGTNWFVVYSFPRITATGVYRSPKMPMNGNRVRYVQTVGGTTPSFTRSISRLQSSSAGYIPKRQLIDRSITLTSLNSVTPSLTVQGCVNAQLIINIGAATTPPTIQLEGSDDNGATFYAIGAALLGVASSTVQVTVAGISAQLLRARVSVIGNTVTAGYVLIKGF